MEGEGLKGKSRNQQTVEYWQGTWAQNARKNGALVEEDFKASAKGVFREDT
jgi:hypothetical protein